MPRVVPTLEVRAEDIRRDAFVRMLKRIYEQLAKVINGLISFGDGIDSDNVNGVWANVVSPGTPDTNFTVTHNLGRIPAAYFVATKSAACDVYTGSVAATTTQLTLRATVAGVTLRLFVL